MNFLLKHCLLIIFSFLCEIIFAQKGKLSDYYLIQRQYENRADNDSTALPLVSKYITKAKKENNSRRLFQGYKDARVFSPDPNVKLKYADSAISVARVLKDEDLLSSAYLSKGIIYYFNFKKYQLALNEFLKAYDHSKTIEDPYYQNKIIYFIATVKTYIGYYEDALNEFEEARSFFECEIKKDIHPNLMFGNQRGYYNTLHQMAVCYRNVENFKSADSLVALGLSSTWKNADYKQEHSYFLKEQGISRYYHKNYLGAIDALQHSLQELNPVDDFAWIAISYSYLGQSKWKTGRISDAIQDFNKVDSIFNKYAFVPPEVADGYEILIDYYGKQNNSEKSIYYVRQLVKVNSSLRKDIIQLSSKIKHDYDTKKLLQNSDRLEKQSIRNDRIIMVSIFALIFLGFYLLLRSRSKKQMYGHNRLFGINLGVEMPGGTYRIRQYNKTDLETETVNTILLKLKEFELNHEFLERGIQIQAVAEKFGVNEIYLSQVINEHKGASFNRYISELRIAYITDRLNKEKKILNYTLEALADECGIGSRSNFSNLFHEINGVRPTDFIKNKLKELKDNAE